MNHRFRYRDAVALENPELADILESIVGALKTRSPGITFMPEEMVLALEFPPVSIDADHTYYNMELRLDFHQIIPEMGIYATNLYISMGYARRDFGEPHPHMPNGNANLGNTMCTAPTWYRDVRNAFDDRDWVTLFMESFAAISTYNGNDAYRRIYIPDSTRSMPRSGVCFECHDELTNDDISIAYDGTEWCYECIRTCDRCNEIIGEELVESGDLWLCPPCYEDNLVECIWCGNEEYAPDNSNHLFSRDGEMFCASCADSMTCSECESALDIRVHTYAQLENDRMCLACAADKEREEEEEEGRQSNEGE